MGKTEIILATILIILVIIVTTQQRMRIQTLEINETKLIQKIKEEENKTTQLRKQYWEEVKKPKEIIEKEIIKYIDRNITTIEYTDQCKEIITKYSLNLEWCQMQLSTENNMTRLENLTKEYDNLQTKYNNCNTTLTNIIKQI